MLTLSDLGRCYSVCVCVCASSDLVGKTTAHHSGPSLE